MSKLQKLKLIKHGLLLLYLRKLVMPMPKCFNVCVERHKRGPIACEDCMELKEYNNESEDERGKQKDSDLDRQDRRPDI